MTDEQTPVNDQPPVEQPQSNQPPGEQPPIEQPVATAPPEQTPPEAPPQEPPKVVDETPAAPEQPALDDDLGSRLERLGGEPAPDITPEEFARLQQAGQIHIDPRGRVRATRRDETDAGISLRKRRAWYAA
jgi:outer membrane biosynthesis protein TonB